MVFSSADKIRDFSNYVLVNLNSHEEIRSGGVLEVDIAKVKEKENFMFLSGITSIISFILILFATVSVTLFIYNLLKMHLLKVKMNIGTFKAFGLSNHAASNIYFIIIVRFLVISLALSLLLAFGFGFLLDKILPYIQNLESGESYFKLWYHFTWITVGLILITTLTVSWFTIRNILSKTPGDLIYNR